MKPNQICDTMISHLHYAGVNNMNPDVIAEAIVTRLNQEDGKAERYIPYVKKDIPWSYVGFNVSTLLHRYTGVSNGIIFRVWMDGNTLKSLVIDDPQVSEYIILSEVN